jgi:hypothetical protein
LRIRRRQNVVLSSRFATSTEPKAVLSENLSADALDRTNAWIGNVIVKKGVCPFAAKPLNDGGIRVFVSEAGTQEGLLKDITQEALALCNSDTTSCPSKPAATTTLIVAPHPSLLFATDYHAQVHFSWEVMSLLSDLSLIPTATDPTFGLQVVNFHPNGVKSVYSDSGATAEDYVTKSPFPTFHLLRERDMFDIVKPNSGYASPELVPARNAKMLGNWGLKECQRLWGI